MNKTFVASVTLDGERMIITRDDYKTKKDFMFDLRANGFKVSYISTPEKFDEDCEKYWARVEHHKSLQHHIRKAYRESGHVWDGKFVR